MLLRKMSISLLFIISFFFSISNVQSQTRDQSEIEFTDSLSLYLFLLDDCPICLNYTIDLKQLHNEYGDQISFIGYFPNFSSKPEKIELFRTKYNIEFPLYTDYYKEQAKKWNAEVTPEAILYNHTTDNVIYQGRIDNKFVRLGKRRNVVTKHDLKSAIEQTLNKKEVTIATTEAIGCFISYNDQFNEKKE